MFALPSHRYKNVLWKRCLGLISYQYLLFVNLAALRRCCRYHMVCLSVIRDHVTNDQPRNNVLLLEFSFKTKDGLKKPSIFCHSFYGFQIIFFKHWQTVTHKIDLYHSALMLSLHEKWSLRFPHMSSPAAKTSLDKAFLQGTQNDCYVLKFYRHSFKIII